MAKPGGDRSHAVAKGIEGRHAEKRIGTNAKGGHTEVDEADAPGHAIGAAGPYQTNQKIRSGTAHPPHPEKGEDSDADDDYSHTP